MLIRPSLALAAAFALLPVALAQKGATAGPCGKDNVCAELVIYGTVDPPNVVGDSAGLSTYRDYRATGGDACVTAEYRTRYTLMVLDVNRDGQPGCAGVRAVTISLSRDICNFLASTSGGFRDGDGTYTTTTSGCSLELRSASANPRIQISGFVPDSVQPQAGDVQIVFGNPHYGETGVSYSSFTVGLVDAPQAAPNSATSAKLTYSGNALFQTYVNGKLNTKLNKTFGLFHLEINLQLLQ